jgi:choline monooxygenase
MNLQRGAGLCDVPRCRCLWRGPVVGHPNMTLSVFPDGMNTLRIAPVSEKRTRLVYSFFLRDCSPGRLPDIERTIATKCGIVREDFGICEATQGNLGSGIYDGGPPSPRQQQGVGCFHTLLRDSLRDDCVD